MVNSPKKRAREVDSDEEVINSDIEVHLNGKRIDQLETELKRVKREVTEVKEVQSKHGELIHGLEKVTRGHNLRIFGLDKSHLFREKKIPTDDYQAVFRFLCREGLRIDPNIIEEMFMHIDTIHELPVGFIVAFNRRTDRQFILQKKKNLASWAPCADFGPKFKVVSVQIDLPYKDQKDKKARNALVDKYKKAGHSAKFVGWNKMAIGDLPAKHYKEFPSEPSDYGKK